MKKLITISIILFAPLLRGDVESYPYAKVGAGFPDIVNGGLGFRHFNGHFGFDVALEAGTMWEFGQIGVKAHPLIRFTPDSTSSLYFGPGIGISHSFGSMLEWINFQADLCLGYQWKNNFDRYQFLQLQAGGTTIVGWPLPMVRLEYGFSF